MPGKLTRGRAWDDAWEYTKAVHQLGYQVQQSDRQREVADALEALVNQQLPIDAIYHISAAVKAAWEVGREAEAAPAHSTHSIAPTHDTQGMGDPRYVWAWMHEQDETRVVSAAQKAQALSDGGASASSIRSYSIPLYKDGSTALATSPNECIFPDCNCDGKTDPRCRASQHGTQGITE